MPTTLTNDMNQPLKVLSTAPQSATNKCLKLTASPASHVLTCCAVLCSPRAAVRPCSGFEPDATQYLLMLALVPSSVGLLLSLGMNYVPFVETSEVAHPNSRWSARSRCGCSSMQHGAADSLTNLRFPGSECSSFVQQVVCHCHQGPVSTKSSGHLLSPDMHVSSLSLCRGAGF